jgi:CubicO group peptidase (beta-lactamase class C family)
MASSREVPPKIPPNEREQLQRLMQKTYIPGLSVAAISGGKISWAESFGHADEDTKKKVDDDSVFWACSLSKPIFAYLVYKLMKTGKLDKVNKDTNEIEEKFDLENTKLSTILDDPRFEGDERRKKITAAMILSHQSGLVNEAEAGIGNGHLKFETDPGTGFKYSGEGLYYLQKVIEKITGKELHDLAKEELFIPFGLGDKTKTTFKLPENHSAVHNHGTIGDSRADFPVTSLNNSNAAGSLHTTALDYARILIGIMQDKEFMKLITPRVDMKTDKDAKKNGVEDATLQTISWDWGWGLQRSNSNSDYQYSLAFHWGDGPGSKAFVALDPNSESAIVYFANGENGLTIAPDVAAMANIPSIKPTTDFLFKKYNIRDNNSDGFEERLQAQLAESTGNYIEAIKLYKKALALEHNSTDEITNKRIKWLEPLAMKYELPHEKLKEYTGKYGAVNITAIGSQLQVETPGGKYDLIPIGENRFAPKNDLTFQLEFNKEKNQVTSHFLNWPSITDKKQGNTNELQSNTSRRSSTAFMLNSGIKIIPNSPNLSASASEQAYPLVKQNNMTKQHNIDASLSQQQSDTSPSDSVGKSTAFRIPTLGQTPKLTRK